jgi:hypothetical protein
VQIARAGRATSPEGSSFGHMWLRGCLDSSGIGNVDLYRFHVERRSDVLLALGRAAAEAVH